MRESSEFRKCPPEHPRRGRKTKGRITSSEPIELGAERRLGMGKSYADVMITHRGREREGGRYVTKEFPSKEKALEEMKKVFDLKEAGVPGPETVRYVEKRGSYRLLYSDLTENGKYAVWSLNNEPEDLLALNLTEEDLKAIKKTNRRHRRESNKGEVRVTVRHLLCKTGQK